MKIGLPSGIGDFSWAWSKLYWVREQIREIAIADGWPYRTTPYVDLCWSPDERAAGKTTSYGTFNYKDIQIYEMVNSIAYTPGVISTWGKVLTECAGHSQILMQPNAHLEAGHKLALWLADLPTEYHYPLYTTAAHKTSAARTVAALHTRCGGRPLVGVSCASYRGSEAWKTWDRSDWTNFLSQVIAHGWQPVIVGGFWDDLSSGVAAALDLPDLVGRTDVGEMVEILRLLDAFITFSSGLNVIRTVLDKPVMALWPDFQRELSTAWCPPAMLASGRYVAALYRDPVIDVWPVARRFLEICGEEMKTNGKEEKEGQGQEARS